MTESGLTELKIQAGARQWLKNRKRVDHDDAEKLVHEVITRHSAITNKRNRYRALLDELEIPADQGPWGLLDELEGDPDDA